ncbi:MAG: hypothetical protein AAF563_23030 [Pseudomonadota bacterium]
MTTDAWRAFKRERRRRICRGIRRTFYLTAGSILAAFVIGYGSWFRLGWTDLPLRCVDWAWGETRQISGELRPEAADALKTWLTTLYGDGSVKQDTSGRLRVRPVVVYFGDEGRLRSLTVHLTDWFSDLRDYPGSGPGTTDDCRVVQHYLMSEGQAAACDDSWVQFFMREIKQDNWPAMTRFFRVNQPSPGHVYDMTMDPHALVFRDSSESTAPRDLPELDCGPPMGHRFVYGTILFAGSVIWFFNSLWPF